jgi:hypothetical protein
MAATPYVTLMDFYSNILFQLEGEPTSTLIRDCITSEMLLNPAWLLVVLNDTEKHDILRRQTATTSALVPDINCYPRGAATALCYDLNGDEIP